MCVLTNVKPKYFTKSAYDKGTLLMCKYGKDNLYNLVENAKYNGFNALKFKSILIHIIYIKNKVSRAIGIIYKARKYANKQTVKQMYYTFVFPYLVYCCEIWGNTSQIHLDSLIKCQKKIVRIMTFSLYDAHSKPLFEQLHILDLKKLIIHRIASILRCINTLFICFQYLLVIYLSKIVASTGIIRGHVICKVK